MPLSAGDEDVLFHNALFFSCIIDKTDKIYRFTALNRT